MAKPNAINENTVMTQPTSTVQDPPEIIYVADRRVCCDGGGGALGHPKVYYSLEDGQVECGYCGRRFIYDPAKAGAA